MQQDAWRLGLTDLWKNVKRQTHPTLPESPFSCLLEQFHLVPGIPIKMETFQDKQPRARRTQWNKPAQKFFTDLQTLIYNKKQCRE